MNCRSPKKAISLHSFIRAYTNLEKGFFSLSCRGVHRRSGHITSLMSAESETPGGTHTHLKPLGT